MGATSMLTKMSICKVLKIWAVGLGQRSTSKSLAVVNIYNLIQQLPIGLTFTNYLLLYNSRVKPFFG